MSFLTLMELLAIREIRRAHEIPLQKIRECIRVARDKYGIEHPFAREHETSFYGNQIAIRIGANFVQVTGDLKHQHLFTPIVQPYLRRVVIDPRTGLIGSVVAHSRGKYRVELNAERGLGLPMVMPTGISVGAVINTVDSEGSDAMAARMLEIPVEAVRMAVEYDRAQRVASKLAA